MEEVALLASRADEQLFLYDLNSGTLLSTYKGMAGCATHCVSALGHQLFIASPVDKPAVIGWCWQKDVPLYKNPVLEKISALVATPDGNFILAGTYSGRFLVWQTCNGNLHVAFDAHYRAITAIAISDDGFHCVTGGEDSVVNVWRLASILSSVSDGDMSVKPLFTLTEHSLPVTSVRCGLGGMRSRVYTSSLDRTCKVFELTTGTLLASFSFPSSINCVTTDTAELRLFAGAADGNIYHLPLHGQGGLGAGGALGAAHGDAEHGLMAGSGAPIGSVAISHDGVLLLAGDDSGKVNAWHVSSGQVLRSFPELKGAVSACVVLPKPHDLFNPAHPKDLQPFGLLRRFVAAENGSTAAGDDGVVVRLKRRKLSSRFDELEGDGSLLGGVEDALQDIRDSGFGSEAHGISGKGKLSSSAANASADGLSEVELLRKEVARLTEQNARWVASANQLVAAPAGAGAAPKRR
eukprot:Opistho-2@42333